MKNRKATVINDPSASVVIESIRDIGYSLNTAVADVIDNSISAGARNIEIWADLDGESPAMAIVDDGTGLTKPEILSAMRLGSKSPTVERHPGDLGRFGMGLKTASFSQCRRMTVMSRVVDGSAYAATWDLDHVALVNKWEMLIPAAPLELKWADKLRRQGTLVLWENLDRVVGANLGPSRDSAAILDELIRHLALVFHRHLERRKKGLTISLNGRRIEPADPFARQHPATQQFEDQIDCGSHVVKVTGFVLPHQSKYQDLREWEHNAGAEGYMRSQGFYLYREGRLIVHGTWFGLARQSMLTQLARVSLEIPNTADASWKIDIKKSSASPPESIRKRLRALISRAEKSAKRPYTVRAARAVARENFPLWAKFGRAGEARYELNSDHPMIKRFLSALSPADQREFRSILALVGSTLPLAQILVDLDRGSAEKRTAARPPQEVVHALVASLLDPAYLGGLPTARVMAKLSDVEPLKSHWAELQDEVRALVEELNVLR